ncbi:MAG: nucleosidase [Gordonia sp. (in: high G+C Gram-positive bacteria)]|uniref:nucleosidase n=1 Tax=Gordonia sp. (in: high G+C Gram-positive bacteria) TaxID=84139 RepID=UPI003BB68F9A
MVGPQSEVDPGPFRDGRFGDVLVVSATRAEAAHVPAGASVLISGLGKVGAAIALTRTLAAAPRRYRRVINIGTAGGLKLHCAGLYLPSRVVEHDLSAADLAALGYPVRDSWDLDGGDGTILATGDTFVNDAAARDLLAQRADLVDMEAVALVRVCADFGLPVRVVKVVSDYADDSAMDWPSAVDAAARDLGGWLRDTDFGAH